jgi:NAD-dependent SIR2 family protein deacetylase
MRETRMTKKIRRTEINMVTRKLTIIRSHGKFNQVYCQRCQKSVTAFSFEQLAAISQTIETGDFHQVETVSGLLVCGNSLESKK